MPLLSDPRAHKDLPDRRAQQALQDHKDLPDRSDLRDLPVKLGQPERRAHKELPGRLERPARKVPRVFLGRPELVPSCSTRRPAPNPIARRYLAPPASA